MRGKRFDKSKIIALRKFKRKYPNIHTYNGYDASCQKWKQRELKRMRKTGTPCSCEMCGNPRKHFKQKTRKEMEGDQ